MHTSDSDQQFRKRVIRTILIWSGALFVVLAFAFTLSDERLANDMLARDAHAWLGSQIDTLGKHLAAGDVAELGKAMPMLISDRGIAGVTILDARGKVLYSAFKPRWTPRAGMALPMRFSPDLVIFKNDIPGTRDRLWLVMDRRPAMAMIRTAAVVAASLLVLLLVLILIGVRLALRRRPDAPPRTEAGQEPPHDTAGRERAGAQATAQAEAAAPDKDLNTILEHMPSCLWWADGALRYRQMSEPAASVFGMEPHDLENKPLWSWLPDQDQALSNREKLKQAVKCRDNALHLAYLAIVPDLAQARWFGEHINIQYDSDGNMLGLYGLSSDITRRRHKEQTLQTHVERARRMDTVGTLVGGIAHEFNNILAGIVGNIFLMRQNQGDSAKTQDRLDRVDILIRKASNMIEQLLAFARKSQAQPGKFSLKAHVEDILRILEPQLKSHARIVTLLHSDAWILANRTQLQQALTHLVDNADRAMRGIPEPTIRVSLNEFEAGASFLDQHPDLASPHLLRLTLADNGQGIDPAVIDHVFEPFFTTREVGEGTGLGLSMVYGMIRHLGGAITVDSKPGAGTTFELYFPRAEAVSIEEDAAGQVHYGNGETILIVEDEPIMRKVAMEVLQKLGYRVIEAIDGAQALREFEAHRQDIRLVMADLIMPIMGGVDVATTIRKAAPDMPVLFMTAHDLADSVGPELHFPNSDLISKPFPISSLSASLRRLIDGDETPPAGPA